MFQIPNVFILLKERDYFPDGGCLTINFLSLRTRLPFSSFFPHISLTSMLEDYYRQNLCYNLSIYPQTSF